MALVVPPGFSHISLQFRHVADPDPWYVTFGVATADWTGDDRDLVQSICSWWGDAFYTMTDSDISIAGGQILVGQDGPDPVRAFYPSQGVVGSSSGAKLPQNCAALIRKNTQGGGRRNQGRMFIPGILDEGQVTATGVIAPAIVSAIDVACFSFLNDLADGTAGGLGSCPMVLLHSTGNTPVPPPTVVTSLTPDGIISTQRRRLR